jgi:pimeloyl-ACP methyl ester carboxylesterase
MKTVASLPLLAFVVFALSCEKLETHRTQRMAETELFEPQRTPVRPETSNRRNVQIQLTDGNVLRGIAITRPNPLATILYFGGGSELAQAATTRMMGWAGRYNVNVVFIDYRGFGASSGAPALRHLPGDAISVFDGTSKIRGEAPTFVMGFAIGSIPATYLAARRPVAGLVLAAPLSSLDDEDMYRPKPSDGPWYLSPFQPMLKTKPGFDVPEDSKPVKLIRQVSAPLLLIHGEADGTVPPRCGQKVYDSAPGDKALLMAPGAGHDASSLLSGPGADALALFLSERLGVDFGHGETIVEETIGGDGKAIIETIGGSD